MDLRQLEIVRAVADTGSFTAALLFLAGALLLGALITFLFGQAQRARATHPPVITRESR